MLVRKGVITAAGLGTRFLPATKAIPKEMLPIVDKPTIQHIVEEAIASGLRDIILVTASGKSSILDHFDVSHELECYLEKGGKKELLKQIREITNMVKPISVRQKRPLGLADAVLSAKEVVGREAFALLLGDDIVDSNPLLTKQMIEFFEINQNAIIALERVPEDKTHLYGIVEGEELRDGIFKIKNIVEKPGRKDAPSNLAIIGRYILPYQIFEILETIEPGKDGEVLFTDGLMELGRRNAVYGYELAGKRYDIGDKLGFLQATIAYALKDPQLEGKLRKFLKESLFL